MLLSGICLSTSLQSPKYNVRFYLYHYRLLFLFFYYHVNHFLVLGFYHTCPQPLTAYTTPNPTPIIGYTNKFGAAKLRKQRLFLSKKSRCSC